MAATAFVSYAALGVTLGFAAGVQPGPFQTFLISRTLQHGWRPTLPAACAPLLSDLPAIALALLLLTSVPAWMQNALYFVGGFFLLFLAWGAYRSFRTYEINQSALLASGRQSFFRAVALNLVNPNPYLFWSLVIGPLLLKGWAEAASNGIAMVSGFYATIVLTSMGVILLFAGIGRLFPKINRILIAISVVALACFGVYQLWLGASALWS
jgi:threonine/homoserine/homoserine lactone efflux protein